VYVDKRKTKRGSYYSFSYIDESGKRIRLKKDQHPHFTRYEDAVAWAKSQKA